MSQKIDIRERRYNGVDYDILHPETNINMVLDSSNNSVGGVNGALYGDGNGNIVGAAISNPNLLDNPWFTVNQRGATSGTTDTYIADRWLVSYGSGGVTWSRTDDTITFQSTTGLSNGYLLQKMGEKLYNSLGGKTVTLSVMLGDYSILSATTTNFRIDTAFEIELDVDAQGNRTFCTFYNNTHLLRIGHEKTPITLRAVKLELGSVSTLANDVAPNYDIELYKCKAYFRRLRGNNYFLLNGFTASATQADFLNPFGNQPFAKTPVITLTGTHTVRNVNTNYSVNRMIVQENAEHIVTGIRMDTNATNMTAYTMALYVSDANSYIDISADLH